MSTSGNAETLKALAALDLNVVDRAQLMAWLQADDELQAAKLRELELRQAIIAKAFTILSPGTNSLPLGGGWILKAVKRVYYKLDPVETPKALKQLEAEGEVGKLLAERLVKFRPELSLREWFRLTDKQRRYFKKVLSTSDGEPSLELSPPAAHAG